jgi:hypothetical protein
VRGWAAAVRHAALPFMSSSVALRATHAGMELSTQAAFVLTESHINKLPPHMRDYAFAYWNHLNSGGPQPNHGDFGLSDAEAQQVRIRLTGNRVGAVESSPGLL